MRLFIAIELPKPMKREISLAAKELRIKSTGGKFVNEDDLHITLHFIGESSDLVGAVNAMKKASQGIRPFLLKPDRYMYTEKSGHKTSFITMKGSLEELDILRESLECALSDYGFAREYKKFSPIVIIGRNVGHDELTYSEMQDYKYKTEMTVNGITLFESRKENGKTVFISLHREKF